MNRIIWRKWHDPLAPLVRGKVPKPYEPAEDEHDPDFHAAVGTFREDGDEEENPYVDDPTKGNTGACVVGPLGIVPMFESNLPSKLFNFWMGDTNFDLTDGVAAAIEAVPGVEALDVYSRYRFRVAVGRAFEERAVMAAVERAVQPPRPDDGLDPLKKMLAKAHKYWAIVVTPDKKHHCFGGETVEEVRVKTSRYDAAANTVVRSWESS